MGIDAEMFVRTREQFTEDDVRRLSYELSSSVGHDRFFMMEEDWNGNPRRALNIVGPVTEDDEDPDSLGKVAWTQDGPPIFAEEGETFIKVSLYTRYYGPGYERGDFPTIYAVASWLKQRIKGEVWYGGDSSGVCAAPFDFEGLMLHWATHGRRPYTRHESPIRPSGTGFRGTSAPDCSFCKEPMFECGGGPQYDFWSCDGCGKKAVVWTGNSKTVWGTPRDDFFNLSKQDQSSAA